MFWLGCLLECMGSEDSHTSLGEKGLKVSIIKDPSRSMQLLQ